MKLLCIYLLILPAALLGYGFVGDTPVKTVNQILSNNSQEITPCTVRAMSICAHNFFPLVALAAAAELVVALAEGSAIAAATAATVNNATTAQAIKEIPQAVATKIASSVQPVTHAAPAAGATTVASAQKAIASAVPAPAQMVAQSTTIAKPLEPVCRAAEERLLAPTLTMPKTLSSSPSSAAAAQVIQAKRTGLWTSIKAAACAIASTAKKAPTHVQQFAASHPYATAAILAVGAAYYCRAGLKEKYFVLKDAVIGDYLTQRELDEVHAMLANFPPPEDEDPEEKKKREAHIKNLKQGLKKHKLRPLLRGMRSLRKQVIMHLKKLTLYIKDPLARDNKALLARARDIAEKEKIYNNRIAELIDQIQQFCWDIHAAGITILERLPKS